MIFMVILGSVLSFMTWVDLLLPKGEMGFGWFFGLLSCGFVWLLRKCVGKCGKI